MKKFVVLGLLAAVLTFGFILAGCDSGSSSNSTSDGLMIFRDTVNGKEVEITISHEEFKAAIWTPKNGDYYIIRLDSVLISSGQIQTVYSDGTIIFMPSQDSPGPKGPITGTLVQGGKLNIPSLPYEGGIVVGISANADGAGGDSGWDLDGEGWDAIP